jgi:hypothetical protein
MHRARPRYLVLHRPEASGHPLATSRRPTLRFGTCTVRLSDFYRPLRFDRVPVSPQSRRDCIHDPIEQHGHISAEKQCGQGGVTTRRDAARHYSCLDSGR